MKRILHVVTTMGYGGVETLLMSIYRNIDREKVQFDFLCHNTCDNYFSKEIGELGGKMYAIPYASRVGYFGYLKELYNFFKAHPEYTIVHSHFNSENGNVLSMAKKAGVPIRISHSHTVNGKGDKLNRRVYHYFIRQKIKKSATHFFACSKDACKYLYRNKKNGEDCIIFNNSISTKRFTFSQSARDEIRKKYNLENKFVLGHVGRFGYEKNQIFCIKLFEEYLREDSNAILLLLGEGGDKPKLEEYVKSKKLDDKILFLGSQSNIPSFLSAMDAFLFPSIYEGLGIVAIEAQANGLPVLASNTIPKETDITDLISHYPLDSYAPWLEAIRKVKAKSGIDRVNYAEKVKEQNYDIEDTSKWLENFYLNLK